MATDGSANNLASSIPLNISFQSFLSSLPLFPQPYSDLDTIVDDEASSSHFTHTPAISANSVSNLAPNPSPDVHKAPLSRKRSLHRRALSDVTCRPPQGFLSETNQRPKFINLVTDDNPAVICHVPNLLREEISGANGGLIESNHQRVFKDQGELEDQLSNLIREEPIINGLSTKIRRLESSGDQALRIEGSNSPISSIEVDNCGQEMMISGFNEDYKEDQKGLRELECIYDCAYDSRHQRSVSMDGGMMESVFNAALDFKDDQRDTNFDINTNYNNDRRIRHMHKFSMDGGNHQYLDLQQKGSTLDDEDLKKVEGNDKLMEIALLDPKRVKRILANRQSAARSKERKNKYIWELEQKIQSLETEATALSAQLNTLKRDSDGLSSENSALKFRLQAMEQQSKLREALNEALYGEVQRLKVEASNNGLVHVEAPKYANKYGGP